MLGSGAQTPRRGPLHPWAHQVVVRGGALAGGLLVIATMTWLWHKTRSVVPGEHARIGSALRELRSLDRTINQDVLRARFQIIDGYDPVRRSYRRIEQLEALIDAPPRYLDAGARQRLSEAMTRYRTAVTAKQRLIEDFKYRTFNLKELLAYLPGAGTGVARAASSISDARLADDVNRVLQLMLLYNLTSNAEDARVIPGEVDALEIAGRQAGSYLVRRRVRTLVLNFRTLLTVKPEVDRNLVRILAQPVTMHEDNVASIYDAGYAAAERVAARYRVLLYGLSIGLIAMVAFGVFRLRRTARALAASKDRLEERVIERTRALDSRNGELRAVLDNVGQALFTVDLDGRLSSERSSALDLWFPMSAPGVHLWTVLGAVNSDTAEWIRVGWEQVRDGLLPVELALDQLPDRLSFQGRHYEIGYRPINGAAGLEKILVVISDVTEIVERTRAEIDQREQLALFQHFMSSRAEFVAFFAECERLAQSALADPPGDRAQLFRALHTLKGNAAMRGIDSVASVCHRLEGKLADPAEELNAADRAALAEVWTAFAARVRALTATVPEDRIEIARADLQAACEGILAGRNPAEMVQLLMALEREPAAERLARIAADARGLAERLGKGGLIVLTESDGDLRFERKRWAPFWAALVHVLRNAIDHGIESPEERLATGKPPAGRLTLRACLDAGRVVIEVGDDGRGLDWDAVRVRAQQLGRQAHSQAELIEELFRGGVSTRAAVNEISGRGAGVAACWSASASLGGSIAVRTAAGQGTTFSFSFPPDGSPVVEGPPQRPDDGAPPYWSAGEQRTVATSGR